MTRSTWILVAAALGLMGVGAGVLVRLQTTQQLGPPGLKHTPIPGDRVRVTIDLPEHLSGYESRAHEVPEEVLNTLPDDTSYGQRSYRAADGFEVMVNVVMMGKDRTSIHRPQFCLVAQWWKIERSEVEHVPIQRPQPYDLAVMKLTASRNLLINGQTMPVKGVYVYWFVSGNQLTPHHGQRMWWMARDLLRTGVLPRWAYVTCFSICPPGMEDALFARMKEFIAAAVPEFQLVPPASAVALPAPSGGR